MTLLKIAPFACPFPLSPSPSPPFSVAPNSRSFDCPRVRPPTTCAAENIRHDDGRRRHLRTGPRRRRRRQQGPSDFCCATEAECDRWRTMKRTQTRRNLSSAVCWPPYSGWVCVDWWWERFSPIRHDGEDAWRKGRLRWFWRLWACQPWRRSMSMDACAWMMWMLTAVRFCSGQWWWSVDFGISIGWWLQAAIGWTCEWLLRAKFLRRAVASGRRSGSWWCTMRTWKILVYLLFRVIKRNKTNKFILKYLWKLCFFFVKTIFQIFTMVHVILLLLIIYGHLFA